MINQNTPEWYLWRNKGIGASDAVVIMGVSPYKTKYQLWEEKCNPEAKQEEGNDFIHQKGHRLEKKARALFELNSFIDMPPILAEYSDWEIARCSMDGFNKESNTGIEIKYVGEKVFNSKEVPVHFEVQIQHQYMVTGAGKIDLVLYNDVIDKIKIIEVKPDIAFIKKMLAEEKKFQELVKKKKEPELSDKDFKIVKSKIALALAEDFIVQKIIVESATDKLKEIRKDLLALAPNHPRVKFGRVTVTEVETKGSVDYSKVPVLKDYDLEPYRKASRTSFKVSVTSEDQPQNQKAKG